jgi:hypothetical protein
MWMKSEPGIDAAKVTGLFAGQPLSNLAPR